MHWIYRNRLDRRQVSTLISLSEVVVGEIYGKKVINNMEVHRNRRLRVALQKELEQLEKQEKRMEKKFSKQEPPEWKTALEAKVPEKVRINLEKAFCKAFSVVFQHGNSLIEKTYNKEELQKDHEIQAYAVQIKGNRKELRKMSKNAGAADLRNMALTTVEGACLGLLGIGIPDIVIFIGMLMKGVYEAALHYGFDYDGPQERLLILKMMEASLSRGEERAHMNHEVDAMCVTLPTAEEAKNLLQEQIDRTAKAFAVDMLLLKFIQGLPVVGVLGGAANPVYYRRIMKYVQLKYRKRYLIKKISEQ